MDYYGDEYRFSPDTNDVYAWQYSTADDTTFNLVKQNETAADSGVFDYVALLGSLSGLATTVVSIVTVGLLCY